MRRGVAVAAALLAAAAAAWWLLRDDGATEQDGPPARAGAVTAGPRGPLLAARPAGAPARDEAPAVAPTPPKPTPPAGPMKAPLRVHVVIDDPTLRAGARVSVLGHHDMGRYRSLGDAVPLGPDGTVSVDVDELLSSGAFHAFLVRVEHPECPRAQEELYLDEPRDREAALATLAHGVELRLGRACVFDGVILGADGSPVAGAAVQALLAEDSGPGGARTFGEGVATGADGRFHLLVLGEGHALLTSATRGSQPACIPVDVKPGTKTDVGTIQLRRGAALAGHVSCGGVDRDKVHVIATWYGTKKEGTRAAKDGFLWIEDGRAVWSQIETGVDESGRFRIDGLEPGPYRWRVTAEDADLLLHPDVRVQLDLVAHAPDDRIDVAADRTPATWEIRDGDAPVEGAMVTIEGTDSLRVGTGQDGDAHALLRPRARYRVTIDAEGCLRRVSDVTTGASGIETRERVTLTRSPAGSGPAAPRWDDDLGVPLILATGPDGVRFAARCRVLDVSGTAVPCSFVGDAGRTVSREHIGFGDFAALRPALRPGHYALEIGGGELERVLRPFDVSEGGPTVGRVVPGRIEVTLRAK